MNSERPNVILIICDTLRKDLLGVYGGPAKTPNLDKLAKDSMVYDNAIAPSPWTWPSHMSMFTGLYPSQHGIHETKEVKSFGLAEENRRLKAETIAEYLKKNNYSTMGISNNIMVSRFNHFDKGFDSFFNIEMDLLQGEVAREAMSLGANPMQIAVTLAKAYKFGKIARYMKEFLKIQIVSIANNYPLNKGAELTSSIVFNSKLEPNFFLFLNFMEGHEPYTASRGEEKKIIFDALTGIKPISNAKVRDLKKRYMKGIEHLDATLGTLIETLKIRGLYDKTMIIISSDHGQAFNEHDYMYHGIYLYDEIIRVPLIVKYPGSKKFRKTEGYQSLTGVPALIKNILQDKDDRILTTRTAFSESFGNDKILPESYAKRKEYADGKYEKLRKTVYKDGYKLVINGSDGTVEEFLKGNKKIKPGANRAKFKELILELRKLDRHAEFTFPPSTEKPTD